MLICMCQACVACVSHWPSKSGDVLNDCFSVLFQLPEWLRRFPTHVLLLCWIYREWNPLHRYVWQLWPRFKIVQENCFSDLTIGHQLANTVIEGLVSPIWGLFKLSMTFGLASHRSG